MIRTRTNAADEMVEFSAMPRGAQWAAQIFEMFIDGVSAAYHLLTDPEPDALSRCRTPNEVRDYANSIRDKYPTFADELIHAANMADGLRD